MSLVEDPNILESSVSMQNVHEVSSTAKVRWKRQHKVELDGKEWTVLQCEW